MQNQLIASRLKDFNQSKNSCNNNFKDEIIAELEEKYHRKFEIALVNLKSEINEQKKHRLEEKIEEITNEYSIKAQDLQQKIVFDNNLGTN